MYIRWNEREKNDVSFYMQNGSDDNHYISWLWHMGASLKNCLLGGVQNLNNRLVIFHRTPSTRFRAKHKTIAFEMLDDAVKIIQDYDEFMNTDSVISQEDSTIKLLKDSKGIVTGPRKISEMICNMMLDYQEKGVQKIVFEEPRASADNKEMLYRAIFEALYNFSTSPIAHANSVYINWSDLTAAEMKKIGQELIRQTAILTQE